MLKQEILALILARGGSKGIPRKNIKELSGKPLIAYTIEAARNSKYIDRIVVSTDDKEIANVAKKFGAEVPFMRPGELATDKASSNDAIFHALKWLKKYEKYKPDYFLNLQATSPLRNESDVDKAIEKFINNNADSLISVTKSDKTPHWMRTINENGFLKPLVKTEKSYTRRQDLPDVFELNGAIYMMKTHEFMKNKSFNNGSVLPYIMDNLSSIDIDNLLDWKFAEFLLEENNDEK